MPGRFTIVRQSNTNLELISKQTEAQEWIQNVLHEQFPTDDFGKAVENGVLLCRLAIAIKPNCIRKINPPSTIKFKTIENLTSFIQACRAMGVPPIQLFAETDLSERRNMLKVVNCIHSLGEIANRNGFIPRMEKFIPEDWTFKNTEKKYTY